MIWSCSIGLGVTGEPEDWIDQAEEDLEAAREVLGHDRYALAAFLAQQSAEKALKALHIQAEGRLWKIHNLVTLGEAVEAPDRILEPCKRLTPHYTATRYPDLADEYDRETASDAIEDAREVVDWASDRL